MKYNVIVGMEIELSIDEALEILKKRFQALSSTDYKIEDGILYSYERTSWNDYGYVKVENLSKDAYERIFTETKNKQLVIENLNKVFDLNDQGNLE